MEVKLLARLLAGDGGLALEGCRVHSDTHRQQLEGSTEDGIPDEDVAVETPAPSDVVVLQSS
jgi:hypothetical protein